MGRISYGGIPDEETGLTDQLGHRFESAQKDNRSANAENTGFWFYNTEFTDPNFHTWTMINATKKSNSACKSLGMIFLSVVVILLQVLILSLMIREANGARCQGVPGGDDGGPQVKP